MLIPIGDLAELPATQQQPNDRSGKTPGGLNSEHPDQHRTQRRRAYSIKNNDAPQQ
jgi:hypothetical protein